MTTSLRSTGRSTGSEVWAALAGAALGLALAGATQPRRRPRWRSFLVGLGLNGAAGALLGAVLAVGLEPGGMAERWTAWLWPASLAGGLAALMVRFPRAAGLPLATLLAVGSWLVVDSLREFRPLVPGRLPQVQPLTDRETITAFAVRADFLDLPESFPGAPDTLYRLRAGDLEPAEWWWTWAVSRGWARSVGAPIPEHPVKFGVYRLSLEGEEPVWVAETP